MTEPADAASQRPVLPGENPPEHELEAWRVQETARINEAAADPESPTSEQVHLARLAA